jgi:hypothetical protein
MWIADAQGESFWCRIFLFAFSMRFTGGYDKLAGSGFEFQ